ncbi:MAG: nucleotidyltransferase [Candidatus Pelagibacter sp.]|nr:nucleotidyltransferase [Candidatus Pelagibacter sp.]
MRKINLIPMAGEGKRFLDEGYIVPKPLIKINGIPMFVHAAKALPKADLYIFICLKKHVKQFKINKVIKSFFSKSKIIILDKVTNGQAVTCLSAEKYLKKDDILTIGACDNGMYYDQKKINNKINKSDLVIWTFKNNKIVSKNPAMYGYVKTNKPDNVIFVSCKKTISKVPGNDHTIIGAFSFKKAETFLKYSKDLIKQKKTINKEFYLDSVAKLCVSSKLTVKVNLVNKYIGWGTPADLINNTAIEN